MSGGSPQKRLELVGGPGLLFGCPDGSEAGGAGDEGDVAGNKSPANGVGEGAADDEVNLVEGLGGESGPAASGMEE